MDYKKLEETSMCYKCNHKAICKIVYQANDCSIQLTKWNCSHYTEEKPQGDIRWTDKYSVTNSRDIVDFSGRVVGHINFDYELDWNI